MEIWVYILCLLMGAWLFIGFLAYGMVFAYMQRNFQEENAAEDLYADMRMGLQFIPQGAFGLFKVVSYLMESDAWDEEESTPVHGMKFLPRHEYRY